MREYDILLIDADGTLFDFNRSEEYALLATLEESKIAYDEEVMSRYRDINRGLWSSLERGDISQQELQTLRFRLLFDAIRADCDTARFNMNYLLKLGKSAYLTDGALRLCRLMKKRGKYIGIITNGIAVSQRTRLKSSLIRDYIDDLFISEEIGAQKPQEAFFEHVLRRLPHSNKLRMLVLGDSLTADIDGGNRAGIDTVWLNPPGDPNPTQIKPKHEIRKLLSLFSIVY